MNNARRFTSFLFVSLVILSVSASATTTPVVVIVNNVTINYSNNQLTINGSGLKPASTAPTVYFNNTTTLTVVSSSNTTVVATLPAGTVAGTYQLLVTNSTGLFFPFLVTYGAVGPQGI